MKDVRFIVIENEVIEFRVTVERLTRMGVERQNIWPDSEHQLVKSWHEVGRVLTDREAAGWRSDTQTIVLILDLALDSLDENFQSGVDSIRSRSEFFQQNFGTLVSTKSSIDVREKVAPFVDAVYWKVEGATHEERAFMFRKAVRDAIHLFEKRRGRPPSRIIQDYASCKHNLSYQLFVSTFGEDVLMDLIEEISANITLPQKPRLVVATGGYSGASVLLLQYAAKSGGSRQVAVKMSRDGRRLADEANRHQEAIRASHKFEGMVVGQLGGVQNLKGHADTYYIAQHFSDGQTLEELILQHGHGPGETALKAVVSALDGVTQKGVADLTQRRFVDLIPMPDQARLTAHELFPQIESGIKRLNGMEDFSKRFTRECKELPQLQKVFETWNDFVAGLGVDEVPVYEQHGDVNMRNLLLLTAPAGGWTIRLIDFAHFGQWPAFYDLTTFRYQLALRMLDPSSNMWEIIPSRILLWDKALQDRARPNGIKRSYPADYGLFAVFIDTLSALDGVASRCLTKLPAGPSATVQLLVELNELMRIMTYTDIPWTKRIWIALLASRKLLEIEDSKALNARPRKDSSPKV